MVSPSVEEFVGCSEDEIIGNKISSYFANDQQTIGNIKTLITDGQVLNYENRDTSQRWFARSFACEY